MESKGTLLCEAASKGQIDVMRQLIEGEGVSANSTDENRRTPLHVAASSGNCEAVQYLVSHGAQVNIADKLGSTPVQDALRTNNNEIVQILKENGAVLQEGVDKLRHTREFESSLARAIPMLCERGNWVYGEAWITTEDNTVFKTSPNWFCDASMVNELSLFRRSSELMSFKTSEGIVSKCYATKQSVWVESIADEPGLLCSQLAQSVNLKSALFVPVVYNDRVLAVLFFASNAKRPADSSLMENLFSFSCRLIVAGLPSLNKRAPVSSVQGIIKEEMQEVYQIILEEGVFSPNLVAQEVDYFYNGLGMQRYYFERFTPHEIAKHVHALIAAKKLAQSSGDPENIRLTIESGDHALYICPSGHSSMVEIERRIEKYLEGAVTSLGQPGSTHTPRHSIFGAHSTTEKKGHSMTHFSSTGTALPNGRAHLSMYFVATHSYIDPHSKEHDTDIWQVSTGVFLREKSDKVREKYHSILTQASKVLTPVFSLSESSTPSLKQLMIAYRGGSTRHFMSVLSDLLRHNQIECARKFYESFANGFVVFSLHIKPKSEQDLNLFLSQASLLHILPSATLTPLLLDGKLSAQHVVYSHAVEKFAYYFVNRQTEEFISLSNSLKNDAVNMGRLQRLQKRLRRDALTEVRIAECILRHPDLVVDFYTEFAKAHDPSSASPTAYEPSAQAGLISKVKKMVNNDLDEQIFMAFHTFNSNLLKTNFFKQDKAAVSFRLNPVFVGDSYPEVPFALFLVLGGDFRGFHVRFRDVARGGIRMIRSPNIQAYARNAESVFDENYGLAYTQQKKNKDIPEGGSKGTILLSYSTTPINPEIVFKKYVDALLDLLLPNKEIVDYYGKQEILFLGPDEGTADYMDWAALHARARGASFWKAFTTGKSTSLGGIPHDLYGMTTRSIHQYVLGILKKHGIDESTVTKFQTGGPDGDLGSNEIKISLDKTTGIVDGSGVLYDPEGINREELLRLAKARKPVSFFNQSLLGPQGFLVLVEDRDKKLPNGTVVESGMVFRNEFHLHPLSSSDLFVPCGGRPEAVNINNVHLLFKEDNTPKYKYIVEGANIFFTQDARITLEKAGVVIYKDASANKGGVTSSSLEVLAALSLSDAEFYQDMQVRGDAIPEFYRQYVEMVQDRIEDNARLEFYCIDKEFEANHTASKRVNRSILTDQVSDKINTLNDMIQTSSLWDKPELRQKVLLKALPQLLIDKVGGLDTLLQRVPESYIRAIFGAYLASRYVYSCGLNASEFAFFEFMEKFMREQ